MHAFINKFFETDELEPKKVETPVADKSILQGLVETTLNHYSKEMIVAGLDFVAGLSEDDLKEWTRGMSVENTARVYRVWRACQSDVNISPNI